MGPGKPLLSKPGYSEVKRNQEFVRYRKNAARKEYDINCCAASFDELVSVLKKWANVPA
jgi:hypothetical protein